MLKTDPSADYTAFEVKFNNLVASLSTASYSGISFVGGIYPCCVNASYSEEDPTIILNDIYQHWKNVSDRDILQAFKETTISFEVNLQDISNIIGFDLNR